MGIDAPDVNRTVIIVSAIFVVGVYGMQIYRAITGSGRKPLAAGG